VINIIMILHSDLIENTKCTIYENQYAMLLVHSGIIVQYRQNSLQGSR
jgi:hypothetical protein